MPDHVSDHDSRPCCLDCPGERLFLRLDDGRWECGKCPRIYSVIDVVRMGQGVDPLKRRDRTELFDAITWAQMYVDNDAGPYRRRLGLILDELERLQRQVASDA